MSRGQAQDQLTNQEIGQRLAKKVKESGATDWFFDGDDTLFSHTMDEKNKKTFEALFGSNVSKNSDPNKFSERTGAPSYGNKEKVGVAKIKPAIGYQGKLTTTNGKSFDNPMDKDGAEIVKAMFAELSSGENPVRIHISTMNRSEAIEGILGANGLFDYVTSVGAIDGIFFGKERVSDTSTYEKSQGTVSVNEKKSSLEQTLEILRKRHKNIAPVMVDDGFHFKGFHLVNTPIQGLQLLDRDEDGDAVYGKTPIFSKENLEFLSKVSRDGLTTFSYEAQNGVIKYKSLMDVFKDVRAAAPNPRQQSTEPSPPPVPTSARPNGTRSSGKEVSAPQTAQPQAKKWNDNSTKALANALRMAIKIKRRGVKENLGEKQDAVSVITIKKVLRDLLQEALGEEKPLIANLSKENLLQKFNETIKEAIKKAKANNVMSGQIKQAATRGWRKERAIATAELYAGLKDDKEPVKSDYAKSVYAELSNKNMAVNDAFVPTNSQEPEPAQPTTRTSANTASVKTGEAIIYQSTTNALNEAGPVITKPEPQYSKVDFAAKAVDRAPKAGNEGAAANRTGSDITPQSSPATERRGSGAAPEQDTSFLNPNDYYDGLADLYDKAGPNAIGIDRDGNRIPAPNSRTASGSSNDSGYAPSRGASSNSQSANNGGFVFNPDGPYGAPSNAENVAPDPKRSLKPGSTPKHPSAKTLSRHSEQELEI